MVVKTKNAEPIWKQFKNGQVYIPNKEEIEFHRELPKLFYGFGKVKVDEGLEKHCKEIIADENKTSFEKSDAQLILKKGIGTFSYIMFLEDFKRLEPLLSPFLYTNIDSYNRAKRTIFGGLKIKKIDPDEGFKRTATFSKKEYLEIKELLKNIES